MVTVLPHVKSHRLAALGVSSSKRSALAPDVPTIAELGFPGFDVTAWFGVMAPAGTPPAVVSRLNRDLVAMLNTKQVQERLLGLGVDRAPIDTPAEFGEFVQTDVKRWTKLVREIGLSPQ